MYSCFSKTIFKSTRVSLLLILLLFLLPSFRPDNNEVTLGPEPKGLPKIDTALTTLTWTAVIQSHHEWLSYNDYQARDTTSWDTRGYLYVACFGSIYNWWEAPQPVIDSSNHTFRNKAVYEQFAGNFYRSKKLRNLIYEWIKPYYIATYKQMPGWKKKMYRELLFETKNYVHHFNYEAALKNYNEGHGICDPTYTNKSPNYFYRMQIWVFQRVHKKQLTRKEIEYWADRMIKDLREIEREGN